MTQQQQVFAASIVLLHAVEGKYGYELEFQLALNETEAKAKGLTTAEIQNQLLQRSEALAHWPRLTPKLKIAALFKAGVSNEQAQEMLLTAVRQFNAQEQRHGHLARLYSAGTQHALRIKRQDGRAVVFYYNAAALSARRHEQQRAQFMHGVARPAFHGSLGIIRYMVEP